MADIREQKLAQLLVEYSVELKKGESCLINAIDVPISMVEALVEAVYQADGYPMVNIGSSRLDRVLIGGANSSSLQLWTECDLFRMQKMDAFIGIRGVTNPAELSGLQHQYQLYNQIYEKQVHFGERINNTKWVVLRYPTTTLAYQAKMSTTEFEDYFYRVTTEVDYRKMAQAMVPAVNYLAQADRVEIKAPGTDLTFSIKGMGAIPCAGRMNIPDGEIYSVPLRDSVNGTIAYNVPSTYQGHTFSEVKFTFKEGKIIEASADDVTLINQILDTDEGARYIGEFALGCNPQILTPIDNTLFDEKIAGSIHFTPGNAYEDCDNGNRSSVHWDLIQIQRSEYGGGQISIDGELISQDGVFVHEAFAALNSLD